MRIGLDFDNTLASYDDAFVSLAREWGLAEAAHAANRIALRDALRQRDGGEADWQRLQGRVYGAEIARARLMDGADGFLHKARSRGDRVIIVSHKTEFGHFDPDRINLRQAAVAWMADKGFFAGAGFGLDPGDVYFEATRADKLRRIATLGLDCYIDDLPEVIDDPDFPADVRGLLFTAGKPSGRSDACTDWGALARRVFQ